MTENRKKKAVPLVLSILCLMSVTVVFTNPVYLRKKSSETIFPVTTESTTLGEIEAGTTSSTTTTATISVTTSVSYSATTSAITSATISATTSALSSATTSATTSSLSSATTSATDTKTTYATTSATISETISATASATTSATTLVTTSAIILATTSATISTTTSATTSSLSSATTFVPASTTISAITSATASATSSVTTFPTTSATISAIFSATSSVTILTTTSATTSAIISSTFSATTLATTSEVTTWTAVDATEAETSPATTSSETKNPCFGHDCGGFTCFPIDDSAHCFDPEIQKIGFLTYDRNMTVKCANGNSNGKLFTKHECLDKSANCEVDQVKIHMQFFEATQNRNEYFINTHADTPQRAMYHMDENENDVEWVVQVEIDHDPEKLGSTWIIEKIDCGKGKCPVFVRASEVPHKGWKRDHSARDAPLLAFDTIDENDEDFWWFIELQ